jgi:RHS repeat-associated protein
MGRYAINESGFVSAGRRSVQTTTDASGTTTTTRRYTDGTDNPAWIDTSGPTGTTTTRFAEAIGADLSASIAADGGVTLSLADPHGDVVTTVGIPAAQADTTPVVGIDGWADYTEYGNPAATSSPAAITAVAGGAGYGWLGAKERSTTDATAGLTLMGVRLYNSATGQFASLDPVPGGNTTAYTYPQDPINAYDLDGLCWAGFSWACTAAKAVARTATSVAKTAWKNKATILRRAATVTGVVATGACIFATAGVCGIVTVVAVGASAAWNGYQAATGRQSWSDATLNTVVDAGSLLIRPLRNVKVNPRHGAPYMMGALGTAVKHPVHAAASVAGNMYYGYRSYRNGW